MRIPEIDIPGSKVQAERIESRAIIYICYGEGALGGVQIGPFDSASFISIAICQLCCCEY